MKYGEAIEGERAFGSGDIYEKMGKWSDLLWIACFLWTKYALFYLSSLWQFSSNALKQLVYSFSITTSEGET